VVDYAHSPDALERVLTSLKRHGRGKIWVVFGCGGERDRGKRPLMGAVAERWADHVVVTDDNPRREDGDAIVADILAGCAGRSLAVAVERDRRLAIHSAIKSAGACDVVLVAGKGHESAQEVGGTRVPFDDRAVVQAALRERGDANQ
jgi:UDP-N-acetylmuramoyl-L-alanyl-D-glutamate--2,6-diaminopimelate ligase